MPPSPAAPAKPADPVAPVLYRLRVAEEAPYDHITVGGVCFSKQTEKVFHDKEGKTVRLPVAGAITPMYPEELERVRSAIGKRIIRWRPARRVVTKDADGRDVETTFRPGVMLSMADGRNRPQPGDEPLAKFLFIETTDEIPTTL